MLDPSLLTSNTDMNSLGLVWELFLRIIVAGACGALIGLGSACLAMLLVPRLEKRFPKLAETVYRV